jgi:hypothetical protein
LALRVDYPPMAAEHFAFLVIGASVESRAQASVDAFLRAYSPGR